MAKLDKNYFGPTGSAVSPHIPVRFKTGGAVYEGFIVKQIGVRRFRVADDSTNVNDGSLVVGSQYVIETVGSSDFRTVGAVHNAVNNKLFTATGTDAGGNGVVNTVVAAKIVQGTNMDPVNDGEMTVVGLLNGSPISLRTINRNTASDFSGNRYKWSLSDDSTETLIILTAFSPAV